MKKYSAFFSDSPLWPQAGLAIVRIICGLLMTYHGWEIFDEKLMKGYLEWAQFKGAAGEFLVYAGKAAELVSGILLVFGLFTRIAALMMIATMTYIAFIVSNGRVWYEDQHPFLFVLLGMVFFFLGPGKWSIDRMISNRIHRK